jgi:hypothetical protein
MQSEHDDQIQALYAELADATDGLVTAQGYMELSLTREPLAGLLRPRRRRGLGCERRCAR